MVRDGVIIVGGLIVVVVQRGFDFVCFVLFGFGSVLLRDRTLMMGKKENLKFESAVILNFDQNSESEFYFEKSESEFGIVKLVSKISSQDSRNSDDQ